MTDVTIRGIDDDVYSLFSAEARRRGVSIGELVTIVMRAFLDKFSGESKERISHMNSLVVSAEDLHALEGNIMFSHIGRLEFQDTVNWDIFSSKVTGLEEIGRLIVPKSFPRLALLTRCRAVGRLIQA